MPIHLQKPFTFKARVHDGQLTEEITPPGLDPARQWYLYEHIRQFCGSRLAQDLTCPKPTVLKPGEQQHTTIPEQYSSSVRKRKRPPSEDESSAPAPKRQRACSYCKLPGHFKCRGTKITCPKLLKEQTEE